jgi:predicted site-specific integrase-resolvase
MTQDSKDWITQADISRRLRVSEGTVRKWIDAELIIATVLPSGRKRIEEAEYRRFVDSLPKTGGGKSVVSELSVNRAATDSAY